MRLQRLIEQRAQRTGRAAALAAKTDNQRLRGAVIGHA